MIARARRRTSPFNGDNRKLLIFSAFADTAGYLYQELSGTLANELGIRCGIVTGKDSPKATVELEAADFQEGIDLAVKAAGSSLRVRSSVMEMLNLRIPNPCICRVTDEEGGPIETAIYPKVSCGVLYGDSAVFRYARSAQDLQMPSGVTTLETMLIHLAAELAGMSVRPGEPLKQFDERHYAVEALRAELSDVEKRLSKEKQLNRKYELAKEKQRVLARLEAVE